MILALASACTEKIDLPLSESQSRLVVDATVAPGASLIRLTRTADYYYNAPSPKITGAGVSLTDGNIMVQCRETEPGRSGIYKPDTAFHGVSGKNYTLVINLKEPVAGESNFTSNCLMADVVPLDSVRTVFVPNYQGVDVWQILAYAQDPPQEGNCYLFQYYRNDTLVSDSIFKYSIQDDKYFNGRYVDGAPVFFIDNSHAWETLHPGDRVRVRMSGITREYFDFITQVQQSGFSIPFYSGPPANVKGNIDNGAVGFFTIYSGSWAETVVR